MNILSNLTKTVAESHDNKKPTSVSCLNSSQQLSKQVADIVRIYFSTLDGEPTTNLYELIIKEVERPLIQVVLEESNGNKSKCAEILGLNRGTLRKKLTYLGID